MFVKVLSHMQMVWCDCLQEAVQHAFGMMDVTQHEDHSGVGAADVADVTSRPFVDLLPAVDDGFRLPGPSVAMRPLSNDDGFVALDAAAFGSDGFHSYGSPSRVRLLHFRVEYRKKHVPIILQDVNCVGECSRGAYGSWKIMGV